MENKRGLSDIVSTVLIILVIVVAVSVIGTIVIRSVGQSGTSIEKGTAQSQLLLSVPASSVFIYTGNQTVALNIERSAEEAEIIGYYISLEDESGKKFSVRVNDSNITPLQTKQINAISYAGQLGSMPVKVSIAAILKDSSGKEIIAQSYKKTTIPSSSIVISIAPPATPNAPTDTLQGSNNIIIDWNDVATATNYNVQRSNDGGSNWSASIGLPTISTYTDTNLPVGTYVHRANACNSGGCSTYSAQSNPVTTQAPPT